MRTLTARRAIAARRLYPSLLVAALLAAPLAGCDSTGADDEITIRGRVTDDATSGAVSGPIAGATVAVAEVETDGDLTALEGEVTTDADGAFTLNTSGTERVVLVTATQGTFRTRSLIEEDGATTGTVSAPTLTAETDAEAAVYLAGRPTDARATVADVAFYVTREVAGRINGGADTATDVALAIEAALEAEAEYADRRGAGGDRSDAVDLRNEAYGTFRAAVFAASTTTAGAAARLAFEQDYAGALADAGASADAQAGAGLAASRATARFSSDLSSGTAFDLVRQARLQAALAGALSVEAAFSEAGASTRLSALADAREQLVTDLASALTAGAILDAETAYRAAVRAELAAETGLPAGDLEDAEAATSTALAAMEASIATATSAEFVGEAVATFHSAARAAVTAALGSGEDLAVDVITFLSLSLAAS